jgi:hypothetical protein
MVGVISVIREGRYEKDGETVFNHDLISRSFSCLGYKHEDNGAKPQPPEASGQDVDDEIPF